MFGGVYAGKKVLVTGHTGFKGSWLCLWLSSLGAEVYGVSIDVPTSPALFDVLKLRAEMQDFRCDIADAETLCRHVAAVKPDVLFHLAAQPIVSHSFQAPVETFRTNTLGSVHVLEASRQLGSASAVVMITSDKAYDNREWVWGYRETDRLGGRDPYSASKAAAEIAIAAYCASFFANDEAPRLARARAGNVIGGGDWAKDRVVVDAFESWSKGQSLALRRPGATRPWQHVLEPLSGYLLLAARLLKDQVPTGEAFNFGPAASEDSSVADLTENCAAIWTENTGLPAPICLENANFGEANLLKLNCDKAFNRLGWQSVLSFSECVAFVANWYCAFYTGGTDMRAFTDNQLDTFTELAISRGVGWSL